MRPIWIAMGKEHKTYTDFSEYNRIKKGMKYFTNKKVNGILRNHFEYIQLNKMNY